VKCDQQPPAHLVFATAGLNVCHLPRIELLVLCPVHRHVPPQRLTTLGHLLTYTHDTTHTHTTQPAIKHSATADTGSFQALQGVCTTLHAANIWARTQNDLNAAHHIKQIRMAWSLLGQGQAGEQPLLKPAATGKVDSASVHQTNSTEDESRRPVTLLQAVCMTPCWQLPEPLHPPSVQPSALPPASLCPPCLTHLRGSVLR